MSPNLYLGSNPTSFPFLTIPSLDVTAGTWLQFDLFNWPEIFFLKFIHVCKSSLVKVLFRCHWKGNLSRLNKTAQWREPLHINFTGSFLFDEKLSVLSPFLTKTIISMCVSPRTIQWFTLKRHWKTGKKKTIKVLSEIWSDRSVRCGSLSPGESLITLEIQIFIYIHRNVKYLLSCKVTHFEKQLKA